MTIAIHHNPDCGTSRNVLAIIRAAEYEPIVIDYLKTGWTRPQLLGLFAAADLTPRTALREKKSPAEELGLLDPACRRRDAARRHARASHPGQSPDRLLAQGVRLCRPSETVLDLLERRPKRPLYKEDGAPLLL